MKKYLIDFTVPKATESIVCILADRLPPVFAMIALFSTNVLPATDQNFKCLTPADTKRVSESERNKARKIRFVEPIVHATLTPVYASKIKISESCSVENYNNYYRNTFFPSPYSYCKWRINTY